MSTQGTSDEEELNPFSFRHFLRWRSQDQEPDLERVQDLEPDQGLEDHSEGQPRVLSRNPCGLTDGLCLSQFDVGSAAFDPDVPSLVSGASSPAAQEQQEDGWGRSFQSAVDSTFGVEEEQTRFSSRPVGTEHYEADDETSMTEAGTSCRRRSQVQQLKEENMLLRRTIVELQRSSELKERRLEELREDLLQRRRREEEEAQDLENMVQSVEQNLHLMTKRAVKAETSVSKVKLELQQLQVEVDALRSENCGLKASESQVVMTMRQNALVASEYLEKTASQAHSSIRSAPPSDGRHGCLGDPPSITCHVSVFSQLLAEAETLGLVSHLLRTIDKISSAES